MDEKLFAELVESVTEMGEISRGERVIYPKGVQDDLSEAQKKDQEKTDREYERLIRMFDLMILQQEIIREMQFKQSRIT
jgi:hypothetical protein